MTSRRRSMWLLTALATPTPPTRRAARPTSVRNWVKRWMVRSSCGEALLLLRIHQPASGGAQARFADENARAQSDIAGKLVGLGADGAADLVAGVADSDAVSELEIEPRQQRGIDRRTERGARCILALG